MVHFGDNNEVLSASIVNSQNRGMRSQTKVRGHQTCIGHKPFLLIILTLAKSQDNMVELQQWLENLKKHRYLLISVLEYLPTFQI